MIRKRKSRLSQLKEIAVIAIPVAFQNLLSTTGSMVDTMMLATLGELTVSAVSMCAQFSTLFLNCYWGFVAGGTLFVTQYWGAGDEKGIRRSYGISLCMIVSIGMIFGILSVGFPRLVMGIYTNNPDVRAVGISYLCIVGWMFPIQSMTVAMSMLLRATEHPRIPLVGGILSVLTNCLCNYILIFGHFGAPVLGFRGAALGTLAASCMNLAVLVVFVVIRSIPYALEFHRCFSWDRSFASEYFRRSSMMLINECGMGFGNTMINAVLGRQSAVAIAAIAIYRTMESMIWAFFTGFSTAGSIIIGKEVGAGNHETAQEKTRFIVYLTSTFVFFNCCCVIALHVPLFTLLGLSGESFAICRNLCLAYCIIGPIRLGNWQHIDCFRSGGDPLFCTVVDVSSLYMLVIPSVYIAHFVFRAPFYVIFLLAYWDEPVRYCLMQRHLYSRKWIKPVTDKGLATIDTFREKYHVTPGYPFLDAVKRKMER